MTKENTLATTHSTLYTTWIFLHHNGNVRHLTFMMPLRTDCMLYTAATDANTWRSVSCLTTHSSRNPSGVFQQPLQSPVFAPSCSHLFGPLHELMGGQKFECNGQVWQHVFNFQQKLQKTSMQHNSSRSYRSKIYYDTMEDCYIHIISKRLWHYLFEIKNLFLTNLIDIMGIKIKYIFLR